MSFVTGKLRTVLRLEGLCVLVLSVLFFHRVSSDWGLFTWLFFVPDLALLGYLVNSKFGALAYNTTHSMIGSSALLGMGLLSGIDVAISVSLIWFAHVGFDRSLGYGLKYGSSFHETHLGRIGKKSKR